MDTLWRRSGAGRTSLRGRPKNGQNFGWGKIQDFGPLLRPRSASNSWKKWRSAQNWPKFNMGKNRTSMASSIAKRNAPLNAPFKNVGTVLMTTALLEHNQQIDVIETLHPANISSWKWMCWKWISLEVPAELLTSRQQQTFSPIRSPLGFVVTRCRVSDQNQPSSGPCCSHSRQTGLVIDLCGQRRETVGPGHHQHPIPCEILHGLPEDTRFRCGSAEGVLHRCPSSVDSWKPSLHCLPTSTFGSAGTIAGSRISCSNASTTLGGTSRSTLWTTFRSSSNSESLSQTHGNARNLWVLRRLLEPGLSSPTRTPVKPHWWRMTFATLGMTFTSPFHLSNRPSVMHLRPISCWLPHTTLVSQIHRILELQLKILHPIVYLCRIQSGHWWNDPTDAWWNVSHRLTLQDRTENCLVPFFSQRIHLCLQNFHLGPNLQELVSLPRELTTLSPTSEDVPWNWSTRTAPTRALGLTRQCASWTWRTFDTRRPRHRGVSLTSLFCLLRLRLQTLDSHSVYVTITARTCWIFTTFKRAVSRSPSDSHNLEDLRALGWPMADVDAVRAGPRTQPADTSMDFRLWRGMEKRRCKRETELSLSARENYAVFEQNGLSQMWCFTIFLFQRRSTRT